MRSHERANLFSLRLRCARLPFECAPNDVRMRSIVFGVTGILHTQTNTPYMYAPRDCIISYIVIIAPGVGAQSHRQSQLRRVTTNARHLETVFVIAGE